MAVQYKDIYAGDAGEHFSGDGTWFIAPGGGQSNRGYKSGSEEMKHD